MLRLAAKKDLIQKSSNSDHSLQLSTRNNFDLIRLFAAAQVAIEHTATHLNYENSWISVVSLFPGVPIFFFISGFLIYGSYVKSIDDENPLVNFYTKRALRLYPALWFCLALSFALVWTSGYLERVDEGAADFLTWTLTSGTFFQFYNPDFLREFGLGSINGSLWTIAVEIQFYVLTPIVFWLLNRNAFFVIAVVIVFCIANNVNSYWNPRENLFGKLIEVSFIPWIYMFILGALVSKYFGIVKLVLKTNFFAISVIFIITWYISINLDLIWGNEINPIGYLALIALLLKIAFSYPGASDHVLKRNDISYGVYIFHMPIINFLLFKNVTGFKGFIIALAFTFIAALVSWFFVEKPTLRLKKRQLRYNS
ncbi:MAG: acyltransferase [Pseudomonadota bacterium]